MRDARLTPPATFITGGGIGENQTEYQRLKNTTAPQKTGVDNQVFSRLDNKHSCRASRASDECLVGDVLGRRRLEPHEMHEHTDGGYSP